eukprot:TRINITY_DN44512_c0_g1_i1.p1 TRINITY_DN44512_c0_g1~~TRINITY_DN44512_c0_g1_i1.p1  ORF type:complete len:216 (+),score=48.64 TRINITY_DN44512_c0_g1_i1:222-869(+)
MATEPEAPQGWFSRLRGMLAGSEANKAARKELLAEIKAGSFNEMHAAQAYSEGTSSAGLATTKKAPMFPVIETTALNGDEVKLPAGLEHKVSLVGLACRASADEHIASWSGPFEDAFKGDPGIRFVDLKLIEGMLVRIMKSSIMATTRSRTPEERHGDVLYYSGDSDEVFNLENRFVGHMFLLDSSGRVRWRGRGTATPEQVERLISFTKTLEQE